MALPEKIPNVAVTLKANVYFDGKVVSHSIHFADGTRKTIGIIYPGTFTFDTASAERMEIIAGSCRVCMPSWGNEWKTVKSGEAFGVAAHSAFQIAVDAGIAEYLCSYE